MRFPLALSLRHNEISTGPIVNPNPNPNLALGQSWSGDTFSKSHHHQPEFDPWIVTQKLTNPNPDPNPNPTRVRSSDRSRCKNFSPNPNPSPNPNTWGHSTAPDTANVTCSGKVTCCTCSIRRTSSHTVTRNLRKWAIPALPLSLALGETCLAIV